VRGRRGGHLQPLYLSVAAPSCEVRAGAALGPVAAAPALAAAAHSRSAAAAAPALAALAPSAALTASATAALAVATATAAHPAPPTRHSVSSSEAVSSPIAARAFALTLTLAGAAAAAAATVAAAAAVAAAASSAAERRGGRSERLISSSSGDRARHGCWRRCWCCGAAQRRCGRRAALDVRRGLDGGRR
jgi:hypothetical protein